MNSFTQLIHQSRNTSGPVAIRIQWAFAVALFSSTLGLPFWATAGTLVVVDTPSSSAPVSRLEAGQKSIRTVMSNLNAKVQASQIPETLCSHPALQSLPELLHTRTQRHLRSLENEYLELLQLSEDLTQAQQTRAFSEALRKGSASLLTGTLIGRAWASFKMASLLGSLLGLGSESQIEKWATSEFMISAESAYKNNSVDLTKEIAIDYSSPESARQSMGSGLRELHTRLETINANHAEAFKNLPPQNRWYSLGADAEKTLVTALDASVAKIGFLLFEIQTEIQWRNGLHQLCEKIPSSN